VIDNETIIIIRYISLLVKVCEKDVPPAIYFNIPTLLLPQNVG